MKRPDVQKHLNEEQKKLRSSLELRRAVHRFMLRNETNSLVRKMKIKFNEAEEMSWAHYWWRMTNGRPDMLWADEWFMQLTAWYLEILIMIMDPRCTKEGVPFIPFIPDPAFGSKASVDDLNLILGLKPPVHYQSLLWDDEECQGLPEEEGLHFDPLENVDGSPELLSDDEESPELLEEEGLNFDPLENVDGSPQLLSDDDESPELLKEEVHFDPLENVDGSPQHLSDDEESPELLKEEGLHFDPLENVDGSPEPEGFEFVENSSVPEMIDSKFQQDFLFHEDSPSQNTEKLEEGKEKESSTLLSFDHQDVQYKDEDETSERQREEAKEIREKLRLERLDNTLEKYISSQEDEDDDFELQNINAQGNSSTTNEHQRDKKEGATLNAKELRCPVCKKSFNSVIQHINKNKKCNTKISKEEFDALRKNYTENVKESEVQRCPSCYKSFKFVLKHINKSKKCKENISDDALKELKQKALERDKLKKIEHAVKSKNKQREQDYEGFKRKQNAEKEASRKKKTAEDYQKELENNRKWKDDQRNSDTAAGRLKQFRMATMFGPIFTCISCHIKHFKSNVREFTNNVMATIEAKIPLKDCIADMNVITKVQIEHHNLRIPESSKDSREEFGKRYICETCLKHLKNGKLPPSSVMNGLQLHETDEELKRQDLVLTELEGALIAKTILFQKIFTLPTSRWTALKDRTINVPIQDKSINDTLVQLPRTPAEGGLIPVSLKRMQKMKNTHKRQLINPDRMFRFIAKAKAHGNELYQDVQTPEQYKDHCKRNDFEGHQVLFGSDNSNDDSDEEVEVDSDDNSDEEVEVNAKDDQETMVIDGEDHDDLLTNLKKNLKFK